MERQATRRLEMLAAAIVLPLLLCGLKLNDLAPLKQAASGPVGAQISTPGAFSIRAESRLEPAKAGYPANRKLEYVVAIRWKGELGAVSVHTPTTPDLENLECLSASVSNRTHPESAEASAEFLFSLKPKGQGEASIGRCRIEYTMGPQTEPAQMFVDGVSLTIGKPLRDWRRIGLIAAAAAVAMALILLVARAALRAARKPTPPPAPPSPFEELRFRLENLERPLLEGDYSAYYGEMRSILCAALAYAGVFPNRPPAPKELADWIETRDSAEERQETRRWLELLENAERARFAGWTPSADHNRSARRTLESALGQLEMMNANRTDGANRTNGKS